MSLELLSTSYSQEKFETFVKEIFKVEQIDTRFKSEGLTKNHLEHIDSYKFIGRTRLSDKSRLGFFVFKSKNRNIENKRVGFNAIIPSLTKTHIITHALVAIFHEESDVWRLSYVSFDIKNGKQSLNTSIKRYTYELGANIPIKTAENQIKQLINTQNITKKLLEDVFSVEKLNSRFFADYKRLFEKLNIYLFENNFTNFRLDKANIRAFSKKLLGRITFLYFLQKKGWLGVKNEWGDGNKDFLRATFRDTDKEKNFYEDYLIPIFFEGLSSKRVDDEFELLDCKIPFLNGGLFEKKDFDSELLMIDNILFKEIFETLSYYNFTIIEDTPHESEVAVDPEMLGKVFENLLEENYKSGKGTFYTLKEIVHYMCKESIYEYLLASFSTKRKAIKKLVFDGILDENIDKSDIETVKKQIKTIKILDPAIGSGAFPMGLLSELVHILSIIDETLDVVETKVDIIQNSIYGIDIDASAVEIAQLRFWLSIVVDEVKPRALPNLDFKIMQGNSLLETINGFDPLEQDKKITNIKKVRQLRNQTADDVIFLMQDKFKKYFKEHNSKKKKEIYKTIKSDIISILEKSLSKFNITPSLLEQTKQEKKKWENDFKSYMLLKQIIKDYRRRESTQELFFYKIYFKEVVDNGGFNIIIGNPPYIMEDNNKDAFNGLHSLPYYQGKTDIWHIFTCKGIELLNKNGILSFIAKNQWLSSASASKMRENIYRNSSILKIVDFGANMVFENADVQTMILFLEKTNENKIHNINYYKFPNIDLKDINQKLIKRDINFIQKIIPKVYNAKENLTFSQYEEILNYIDSKQNFIFDEKKEIIQGIIGEPDKAFIIKEDELNNFNKDEQKYIKMLHTHTQKYYTPNSDKYIFYISKNNFNDKKIENFPNMLIQLLAYKEKLDNRREVLKGGIKWFHLWWARDESFFKNGEKIIFTSRTKGKDFTYTKKSFYGTRNLFFIKSNRVNLKYITVLLNSQLMYFYMKERLKHTGDLLQIDKNQFMKIPLYIPEDTKPFEILVDYIMLLKTLKEPINEYVSNEHIVKSFEEVLDAMVYELYFKEEFEGKLIQFEKEKGYIKFIEYAKEDYVSIGLDETEDIEEIQKSYTKLKEPYNKIRNNLILLPIHFKELIKPIMGSL